MILYPAIDLKDGACVRLERGDMDRATLFNLDPVAQARTFAEAGCDWLHIVDLDAAITAKPMNAGAVEAMLAAVEVKVQLAGGIRDLAAIERWLAAGAARVVLGTAAVKDPELVRQGCRRFPGRVAVALEGFPNTLRRMEAAGVEVHTYSGAEMSAKGHGGPTCLTRTLERAPA